MTDDYLTTSNRSEHCVWCPTVIPAGTPLELVVERGDRRWYSCSGCAAETRVGSTTLTTEETA